MRPQDGAAVEYVWDIFNKDKQRTQRVNDVLEVKGEGSDPWRIVGEAASGERRGQERRRSFRLPVQHARGGRQRARAGFGRSAAGAAEGKPLSYAPVE